jgi:hypothetical protein
MILALLAAAAAATTVAPEVPPAGDRNLIPNGGFEAGFDNALAIGRWYVDGLDALTLSAQTPAEGRYGLRVPFSRFGFTVAPRTVDGIEVRAARPVRLAANQLYTFSAALRADPPGAGRLLLVTHAPEATRPPPPLASRDIHPSRDWRRVALTVRTTEAVDVYWAVEARGERPGAIELDALHLAAGRGTRYSASPDTAVTLRSVDPDRIVTTGQQAVLRLRAFRPPGRADASGWQLLVHDVAGQERWHAPVVVPTDTTGHGTLDLRLPTLPNGYWRATLMQGPALLATATFAVLPAPRRVPAGQGAFGACATLAEQPLRILRRAGFSWLCLMTSSGPVMYWDMVERTPGRFTWYDAGLERARALGFEPMLHLEPCRTPRWAEGLPVARRRALWANYVQEIVGHYAGLVRYWTIADEIQNAYKENSALRACWTDVAGYADWHRAGAAAIRAANPRARIILNARDDAVRDVLALLPAGTVDILGDNTWHVPEILARSVGHGRAAGIREFWAPGIAVLPTDRSATADVAANRRIAAGIVQSLALGVRPLFQYTATHVGNTNAYSIFAADSSLRPAGVQWATLAWLLDGARSVRAQAPTATPGPVQVHEFEHPDGMTVFALLAEAGTSLDLPPALEVLDAYANPVARSAEGDWRSDGASFVRVPTASVAPVRAALGRLAR